VAKNGDLRGHQWVLHLAKTGDLFMATDMRNCNFSYEGAAYPPGYSESVAFLACNFSDLTFDHCGWSGLDGAPIWIADEAIGCLINSTISAEGHCFGHRWSYPRREHWGECFFGR
jgi:hypothetical protein